MRTHKCTRTHIPPHLITQNPTSSHTHTQTLLLITISGETLRLQFPREDLGFVYHKGAIAGSVRQPQQQQNNQSQQQQTGKANAESVQQQQQQQPEQQKKQKQSHKQPEAATKADSHKVMGSAETPPPAKRGAPYVPCSAPGE